MKMLDFNNFKKEGEKFLTQLTTELVEKSIAAYSLRCDHLCYRVENFDEYTYHKNALSEHGRLLTEAIVNGRAICTFILNSPFRTEDHEVWHVELPAPKSATNYKTGFEHAEFIIKDSFEVFSSKFPTLSFAESGHRNLNPELCLKLFLISMER